MTEETNEAAAAAAAEPAPEAEAARVVTPTDPPNPPDPIPDPPTDATLNIPAEDQAGESGATESTTIELKSATDVDTEELNRIAEEQRARALDDLDAPIDTGANEEAAPVAVPVVVPYTEIGQRVFLRFNWDGEFNTAALVTAVNNETGVINATAIPDGEVPRPISNIPYFENAPKANTSWAV